MQALNIEPDAIGFEFAEFSFFPVQVYAGSFDSFVGSDCVFFKLPVVFFFLLTAFFLVQRGLAFLFFIQSALIFLFVKLLFFGTGLFQLALQFLFKFLFKLQLAGDAVVAFRRAAVVKQNAAAILSSLVAFQKRDDGFDIKNDYQEQKQNECQQHQNNGNDAEIVGAGKIAAENPGHDVQIAGHRA